MTVKDHEIQEAVDIVREHGSIRAAAQAEGKTFGWIQRRVAKAKQAQLENRHGGEPLIPDGYRLKGTSTLYGPDGQTKLEWVKTDADRVRQQEMYQAVIDELVSSLEPIDPLELKSNQGVEALALYPISDHHIGMMAWGEETQGESYDMKIGERLLAGAMDFLLKSTPPCEEAVVMFMGDFMHYDSMEAVTPSSRNMLDSDTRYQKMARVAIRCARYCIEQAAAKHAKVRVIIEIGNHDLSSMAFMMETLSALYEGNPRITVDTSPAHFHYYRFGKNLLMSHHGHGRSAKLADLPLIMATDRPEEWGATTFRYCFTGHVHHDQVKDFPGCRVESLRVLGPADAYAANNGYRSKQDMKAILFHPEFGETARFIVNPEMLK